MGGTKPDGTVEEGGFLSRWARLKKQGSAEAAAPVDPPTTNLPALNEEEAALQAQEEAEQQRELEELIAKLPSIDKISATTDVTGFMNARIPDLLRNAALRAAWSADPAIRDFLNDAREYALDYNTPGAAYGYGPLTDSDRDGLAEMVRGIFGDAPIKDESLVESADAPECQSDASLPEVESAALQQSEEMPLIPQSVRLTPSHENSPEILEEVRAAPAHSLNAALREADSSHVAAHQNPPKPIITDSNCSISRRRGGGAMPL